MGLPDTLPCKCMNPSCGFTFYARNPVSGGGNNFTFSGNMTNCPRCGQTANYADWNTDAQGNFHLGGFFKAVRNLQDAKTLETLKVDLEAANDTLTAVELADTLVELEPSFAKFKQVLNSMPANTISSFITTLIAIITLVLMYQTFQSTNENHKESIDLQKEQQDLASEQFEYQKARDKNQDNIRSQTNREQEEIKAQIDKLQRDFEKRLKKVESRTQESKQVPTIRKKSTLKGNCRNKPCPCGSGQKSKKCHPSGYTI